MPGLVVGLWLGLAAVAANLPWLSERWLLVVARQDGRVKPAWFRFVEWGLLYGLLLGLGFGLEYKTMGNVHPQAWEFYTVTLCLFAVSALPGFVYRYQVRRLLGPAGTS